MRVVVLDTPAITPERHSAFHDSFLAYPKAAAELTACYSFDPYVLHHTRAAPHVVNLDTLLGQAADELAGVPGEVVSGF